MASKAHNATQGNVYRILKADKINKIYMRFQVMLAETDKTRAIEGHK